MATPSQLKAAQAKLKAATKARDALKASITRADIANAKQLAKANAAVAAAQAKVDKYTPIPDAA